MVRASLEIGNSNQELMEKSNRRKWKVWLVALVLFIIIVLLAATGIVLLSGGSSEDEKPTAEPITLENVLNGRLMPNRFNGTWISDYRLMYTDEEQNFVSYNMKEGKKETILSFHHPIISTAFDHQLSPDGKYLLLAFDYQKIYRYSYSAQYLVVDINSNDRIPVLTGTNNTHFDLVVWGPEGNSLALVQNNNVFYKKSVLDNAVRLSDDGVPGAIYNGVPDWVYEEEIFSSNKALWFSEDGSHLAYAKFDDIRTQIMPIPFYGSPGDLDFQYTRTFPLKYPKAGTVNPNVALITVDLTTSPPTIHKLPPPSKLEEPILNTVTFFGKDSAAVLWTNRVQNESTIMICQSTCKEIYDYNERNGWVDMLRPLLFNSAGDKFFMILPKEIGGDSWRQIAMMSLNQKEENSWAMKFITNEANTVTELLYWDNENELLWFMATSTNDSAVHHLYNTDLSGKIRCITCSVKHSSGSWCLYNDISMSKQGSYIAISCLGPQIPEVYIYSKDGKKIMDWEMNEAIHENLKDKALPTIRRLTVQVAPSPMPPAQVLLMLPQDADLSGTTKYPLLVSVYGGPDSYQVLEKWTMDWGVSLVSRHKMILAHIDGRGSGLKGNNNLFAGYRRLGTVEINDQINVTRRLQKDLPYIDSERSCIWGWSYGGYASTLSLAHGGDTFKCAIAVAPVTDWSYYDSIYTERYMGLPTINDNILGYTKSQLNNFEIATALSKKKFMLVHGTLDDNVHYQQSMMLSRVLQLRDVLFTQMSYPDEDHSLGSVKKHLYHSIEQFLQRNLLSKT